MREIKFRAWDAKNESLWNSGSFELRTVSGKFYIVVPMLGKIADAELEQFTGLTDSEGVEIYEGDFVEFTYWWFDGAMERDSVLSGVITYEPQHMSFALRGIKNKAWLQHVGEKDSDTAMFAFFNFTDADFHVRGNIHENPELLEAP